MTHTPRSKRSSTPSGSPTSSDQTAKLPNKQRPDNASHDSSAHTASSPYSPYTRHAPTPYSATSAASSAPCPRPTANPNAATTVATTTPAGSPSSAPPNYSEWKAP